MKHTVHTTADGPQLRVVDMSTNHLERALRVITKPALCRAFAAELIARRGSVAGPWERFIKTAPKFDNITDEILAELIADKDAPINFTSEQELSSYISWMPGGGYAAVAIWKRFRVWDRKNPVQVQVQEMEGVE